MQEISKWATHRKLSQILERSPGFSSEGDFTGQKKRKESQEDEDDTPDSKSTFDLREGRKDEEHKDAIFTLSPYR